MPTLAIYFLFLIFRDVLSSLTSMIVKSGHGSLLSKIVSTSTFQQESLIKKWICENVQVNWSNVINSECPLRSSQLKRNNVAHEEKSKAGDMVSLETWWGFFLKKYFKPTGQKLANKLHAKFIDVYLIINFALFNLHHNKGPAWPWKGIVKGYTSLLRTVMLLWVNFH